MMMIHNREMSEPEIKAYISRLEDELRIQAETITDRNEILKQVRYLLFTARFNDRNDTFAADKLYAQICEIVGR